MSSDDIQDLSLPHYPPVSLSEDSVDAFVRSVEKPEAEATWWVNVFVYAVLCIMCSALTYCMGRDEGVHQARQEAVNAGAAVWVVDQKTGRPDIMFRRF